MNQSLEDSIGAPKGSFARHIQLIQAREANGVSIEAYSMLPLADRLAADITAAQKARLPLVLGVLRGLKAALTQASLLKGNINTPLTEPEIIAVIRKQVAQREESIAQFTQHGALEKADQEKAEAEVLQGYLPPPPTQAEIDAIVTQAIAETGAATVKDMGRAIKRAGELANGRVEGKTLSTEIKARLS